MNFEINKIHNVDCMDLMAYIKAQQEAGNPVFAKRRILAIVDPPYGIGEDGESNHSRSNAAKATLYKPKKWDNRPPSREYFDCLFDVSVNQIIWGANHFGNLPPSSCWIVWDKDNTGDFADCELAFTSFKSAVRKVTHRWNGMFQEPGRPKETRIHPTQKPVALMIWLLDNYAKQGDLILDTHSGSGSVARACVKRGFDFIASELDPDYHRDSLKLLAEAKAGIIPRSQEELEATGAQPSLFDLS